MTRAHSLIFTLSALLIFITTNSHAEKAEVVNVDGREIILNTDGTWNYLSTDRFVNTKDGTRLRLKEDGHWQIMGNAPLTSKEQVRTTDLDMQLQKIVIESYKKKVQKNTSIRTQTVFYIRLNYSAQAERTISVKDSDIAFIEVRDDNAKNYKVLSIKPGSLDLKPGSETTITIRVEKSPSSWNSAKSMEIIFKPGILDIKSPIKLSQRVIDFNEKNVNGFE